MGGGLQRCVPCTHSAAEPRAACCGCDRGQRRPVGQLSIAAAALAAGGPKLRTTCLTEDLFAVAVMRSAAKDLMAMKVAVVAVGRRAHPAHGGELEVRNEGKSGNKAWLRRRLHAAIVREHLEATGGQRRVGLNHGVSAQIVSCGCWLDHIGHSSTSSLNLDVGWACGLCTVLYISYIDQTWWFQAVSSPFTIINAQFVVTHFYHFKIKPANFYRTPPL